MRATPETLTLVRRRAQPGAAYIARLALTAVFAYLIALQFAGNKGPVLAPLTALLVIQVSLSHTLRSAARRVISVVAGVLLAVGLSVVVGFTWWSLGILIAVALAVLSELATAVAAIGDHIRAGIAAAVAGPAHPGHNAGQNAGQPDSPQERAETELEQSLARARLIQDELAEMLADPGRPDWSMRGELLMLLDRLHSELQEEHRARVGESWPVRGSARRGLPRWVPPQPPRARRPSRPGTRPRGRERPLRSPRAPRPGQPEKLGP